MTSGDWVATLHVISDPLIAFTQLQGLTIVALGHADSTAVAHKNAKNICVNKLTFSKIVASPTI